MQNDKTEAYASRQLKSYKESYLTDDLELLAVNLLEDLQALSLWRTLRYTQIIRVEVHFYSGVEHDVEEMVGVDERVDALSRKSSTNLAIFDSSSETYLKMIWGD